MLCVCYRIDPPSLVAALITSAAVARYQQSLTDELPALADRGMIIHLRRMVTLASRLTAEGLERLSEAEPAGSDALLTDMFAVAAYRGWPLPAVELPARDLPVEDLPRGLFGADDASDGARLWLIDDQTLALARTREVGALMDRDHPHS